MRGPLGWLIGGFNKGFDCDDQGLRRASSRSSRGATILGLALLAAVYYGACHFVTVIPGGFVPDEDPGVIFTTFILPGRVVDGPHRRGDEARRGVSRKKLHGVKTVITMGGFNLMNGANTSNVGSLILTLEPWDEREAPELGINALSAKLRAEFGTVSRRRWPSSSRCRPCRAWATSTAMQFELQDRGSHTIADLANVSQRVRDQGCRPSPRSRSAFNTFRADVPQVKLDIDRDKVKALGIPLKTSSTRSRSTSAAS